MPTYDYRCPDNDLVVEVEHRMSEQLRTWGELCARSGRPLGRTPAEAPVERMATGGNVIRAGSLGSTRERPCDTGPCGAPSCGSGGCAF